MTQDEALDILKLGHNVFLTGPPGSGKTFLLNKYINYLKKCRRGVACTASTGIAATHMGGVTIHSWSGLGIKEKLIEQDLKKLLRKSYLKKRFKNTGVLIIDEISMLHAFQFDLINQICQAFKGNLRPFGGLQVVCSGDLFQLPPVQKRGGVAKFITESEIWKRGVDIKICYLEEQYRQKSGELLNLLNHIRNNASDEAQEILLNNKYKENILTLTSTKLYTHNVDIDTINNFELSKINEKEFVYHMDSIGNKNIVAILKQSCLAPEKLVLKKGAKVMFVKNNFAQGYVNGTLGNVIGFNEDGLPIIEIFTGKRIIAMPVNWTIEEDEEIKADIRQIPLRLAWAITIHKSQGMNLDAAEIDLSKSFVEGMGYVALSRLRSLAGLKLIGINDLAFLINEEILEIDKIFKQKAEKAVKDFREMSLLIKKEKQKQFFDSLPRVNQDKKINKEKIETKKDQDTKELIKKRGVLRYKNYKCQTCDRVIRHRGNCLPCNIKIKNGKKYV